MDTSQNRSAFGVEATVEEDTITIGKGGMVVQVFRVEGSDIVRNI